MKNKTIKTLITVCMIAIAVAVMSTSVLATDYLNPGAIKPEDNTGAAESVQTVAGSILAIVQVVAISVAIIMLIVLAIKYISASPEGKADIKKSATIYIVGAVLLFAASGILEIIKNFAGNINPVK